MNSEKEINIPGISSSPAPENQPKTKTEYSQVAERELPATSGLNQRAEFFQEKISGGEELSDAEMKELQENPLLITLIELRHNKKIANDTAEYYKKMEDVFGKL